MTQSLLDRIASHPCCVCQRDSGPAHHILGGSVADAGIHKGTGQRTPDMLALPMCHDHHAELHRNVTAWEARYDTQMNLLHRCRGITPEQALAIAQTAKPRKPAKKSAKILPRRA